jgi:putative ABC transport system ATP-binding protein
MKTTSVIQLSRVTKDYVSDEVVTKVLHGIDLTIKKGEFIAITGPSGSGKSTLLNLIGLLDTATTGTYILNGHDVTKLTEDEQSDIRNREIGFVFQSFNLLKRISILENVILPAIYTGTKKNEREAKALELLTEVGLAEHARKKPNQLSGGQQQRVAIARALMNNPAIILADEPTGNLDTTSGNEIMHLLKSLNKKGNTVVLITHEQDIASQAKRIITVKDGLIQK